MGKPARTFAVGDRVYFLTENAHLYADSHWGNKLAIPRAGTVIKVSNFASRTGEGTILVQWDALASGREDAEHWQKWTHSEFVRHGEAPHG